MLYHKYGTLAPGGITEDKEEEDDPWPPTPPEEPEPDDEEGDDWLTEDWEEDENMSTSDYLNIISTALGAAALIPTPFPIVNGALRYCFRLRLI